MSSAFSPINEDRGEAFQSEPLAEAFRRNPGCLDSLAAVATLVGSQFLGAGWMFRVHSGSLTYQHRKNKHSLVKVFVDVDNSLADKAGIQVTPDPIVVGIELTFVEPFVRDCVRNRLSAMFSEFYLDPRKPRAGSLSIVSNDKYWFNPHPNHFCDIVFLPDVGELERLFPVERDAVEKMARRIEEKIANTSTELSTGIEHRISNIEYPSSETSKED